MLKYLILLLAAFALPEAVNAKKNNDIINLKCIFDQINSKSWGGEDKWMAFSSRGGPTIYYFNLDKNLKKGSFSTDLPDETKELKKYNINFEQDLIILNAKYEEDNSYTYRKFIIERINGKIYQRSFNPIWKGDKRQLVAL